MVEHGLIIKRKKDQLVISGSILCVACQDHGFINDGKCVKC